MQSSASDATPAASDAPASADGLARSASAAEVAQAFSYVPLWKPEEEVAQACVDAVRALSGAARLVLPPAPLPRAVGDPPDGLQLLLRFPAGAGEGELWAAPHAASAETARLLEEQFARIWAVQRERAAQATELDRLRFHLSALQQVTHGLAAGRGAEETERLALDSVKEVFFAWWAALYRTDEEGDFRCRTSRSLRGETIGGAIPAEAVRALKPLRSGRPTAPEPGHPIRRYLPEDVAVLASLDLGDAGHGLIALGPRMTEAPYDEHDRSLLQALADTSAIALRNADLVDRLRTQAIKDALTGCDNRRGFDERLTLEFARCRRYGRTLSLVFIDIDHFKQVNDDFGHDVGDDVLRRVGRLLNSSFRITDGACRLGGEEFALIFPETPKEESVRLAERMRTEIEAMAPDEVLPRELTASLGVATYPDDAEDLESLVRAADQALYRAKDSGRNRVAAAQTTA